MKYRFVLQNSPKSVVIQRPNKTAGQGCNQKTENQAFGLPLQRKNGGEVGLKLNEAHQFLLGGSFPPPFILIARPGLLRLLQGC